MKFISIELIPNILDSFTPYYLILSPILAPTRNVIFVYAFRNVAVHHVKPKIFQDLDVTKKIFDVTH